MYLKFNEKKKEKKIFVANISYWKPFLFQMKKNFNF